MLKLDKPEKVGLIVCLSYFIVNLILNIFCNFQQMHNDYWDLLFMAKHIDFSERNSLFNQFMPIGYPLLLYLLIKSGSDIILPVVINSFIGALISYLFYYMLQKILNVNISLICLAFFLLLPINFVYFNQAGGDVIALLFFTFSSFLLINSFFLQGITNNQSYLYYLSYGILSGIGALFRYHVFVSSLFFIFSLLFFRKGVKIIPFFVIGLFISYSFQIFINLLSGHLPFEMQQGKMSVYIMMYNNWFNISREKLLLLSPAQIILNNFYTFLKKYGINFLKYFIELNTFPILVVISSKNRKIKSISLFLFLFISLYLSFFSAFFSRRMPILILPFTMLCFGFLIDEILNYSKKISDVKKAKIIKVTLYSFIALFFIAVALKDIFYFKMRFKEAKTFIEVENYLKANGCTSAFQTFTTDFNFYFRTFPEHTPHINGGWSRIGTYKFNEVYPEMSVNSLDDFINDCKKHKIKFLLLTKDAYLLLEELGKIYSLEKFHSSIIFKKEIDRFKIFELS